MRSHALTLLAGVLAIAACRPAGPSSTPAGPPTAAPDSANEKVTLLGGYDVAFGAFYVADKGGYFKREGLDPEIKYSTTGKAAVDALVAGAGVMSVSGGLPGVAPAAAGAPVAVVGPVGSSERNVQIIVRDDVKRAPDLKGKKVGFPQGTSSQLILQKYLMQNGMSKSDVVAINIAPAGLLPAMQKGDIDVAVIFEPHASRILQDVPRTRLLTSSKGIDAGYQLMVMRRDFIDTKRDAARKVLRAMLAATDELNAYPDEAATSISGVTNIDLPSVKQLMPIFDYGIRITPDFMESMDTVAAFLFDEGLAKRKVSAAEIVDADLLREVAPDKVSVAKH